MWRPETPKSRDSCSGCLFFFYEVSDILETPRVLGCVFLEVSNVVNRKRSVALEHREFGPYRLSYVVLINTILNLLVPSPTS